MKKSVVFFVVVGILIGTSFLGFAETIPDTSAAVSSDAASALVRLYVGDDLSRVPREFEKVARHPGESVDVILSSDQLETLGMRDGTYEVLISDVDAYDRTVAASYHSLAETEQMLADIADDYSQITQLTSLGKSYQDRDIWCLEVSDNPGVDEGEPGVVLLGLHHAREWPSLEICLYIADTLTSEYGSDTQLTSLVDSRRIWIVPCVNPDGYYYDHDQGHDWRKNRHYFPEFGTYGVDLNRNYPGSCNGDPTGSWGSIGIASATHNPAYSTYCGPGPFSELETQAVQQLFLSNNVSACITWHTYSELVLWPWAYSTIAKSPDDSYMKQVGQEIASRITRQSGSGTYTPSQSSGLYPTTGDTTDWTYGHAHYILGRPTFSYTIEACSSFHPSSSYLDQIVSENFDGALYLLTEAENIQQVVPRVIPPRLQDISYSETGDYTVQWEEVNPAAQPDVFQLDELSGLSYHVDDAETPSSYWELERFTLSDERAHSGAQSYQSHQGNGRISTMTSIMPLPILNVSTVSFWTWYNIEENWDFAFFEVSREGRCFEVIDSYTGSSDEWQYKEYDLSKYYGDSVFLRFRYSTDEEVTGEGFYVDDISPLAQFEIVATLSDTLTTDSYEITGRQNGTYFYRIRGENSEHGWGDFSTLQYVLVGDAQDTEPPSLTLSRPAPNRLYFNNRNLLPFFATVIIGEITIEAEAFDPSGIKKVEFLINGDVRETDSTPPYNWTWKDSTFLKKEISIRASDYFENNAEQQITIWKFF